MAAECLSSLRACLRRYVPPRRRQQSRDSLAPLVNLATPKFFQTSDACGYAKSYSVRRQSRSSLFHIPPGIPVAALGVGVVFAGHNE